MSQCGARYGTPISAASVKFDGYPASGRDGCTGFQGRNSKREQSGNNEPNVNKECSDRLIALTVAGGWQVRLA